MDVVPTGLHSYTKHSTPSTLDDPLNLLALPESQLIAFNNEMKDSATDWVIENLMVDGAKERLIAQILRDITDALAETGLKSKVICPGRSGARAIVERFSEREVNDWTDAILAAVRGGGWASLVAHPILRKPLPATHEMVPVTSLETREQQATRLHGMFHLEYQGGAAKRFINALDKYHRIYNKMKHFGRIIPIVQSSCAGKSRMVEEMGNTIPTLSVCFRGSQLPEDGWPPSDEPARRFFMKIRPADNQYKGEELAGAFLGAVAHVVAKMASLGENSNFMADWQLDNPTNVVKSRRYTCFAEVESMAETLLLKNRQELESIRISSAFKGVNVNAPTWHIKIFKLLTQQYFSALSQVLKKRNMKYFVLAFDECSQLNVKPRRYSGSGEPMRTPLWDMSLIAMQRVIKAYDDYVSDVPFWFLLLDTNSSVVDLAPRSKNASSHRFVNGYTSLPPWPFVGFNQMVKTGSSALAAQIKFPTDVLTIQHLQRYGRPYWSQLPVTMAVKAAFDKLFSGDTFDPRNKDHVFVAFAARACLEIGSGMASERLAMEAVRSHMRILTRVSGNLSITVSPSEPMLAIAAAVALNQSEETYQQAMEILLDKLILKGIVLDRGELGELSTRILFLLARDKATISGRDSYELVNKETDERTIPAVRLSVFLKTLLGDNLGIPDRFTEKATMRGRLLEESEDVWINFTHFVQVPISIDDVTPSMLLEAWSSGFAFQCSHNQPVIDGLIVAYFGSLEEPFDICNLFVIPWQTKAKTESAELSIASSLTAPFLIREDGSRHKPWHVVILVDLVTTSAFGTATGPRCDISYGHAKRPTGKRKGGNWRGYAAPNETEGNRYCVNIRGHLASQYPVLEGLELQFNQLFQRTLGCENPEFVKDAEEMERDMERVKLD